MGSPAGTRLCSVQSSDHHAGVAQRPTDPGVEKVHVTHIPAGRMSTPSS